MCNYNNDPDTVVELAAMAASNEDYPRIFSPTGFAVSPEAAETIRELYGLETDPSRIVRHKQGASLQLPPAPGSFGPSVTINGRPYPPASVGIPRPETVTAPEYLGGPFVCDQGECRNTAYELRNCRPICPECKARQLKAEDVDRAWRLQRKAEELGLAVAPMTRASAEAELRAGYAGIERSEAYQSAVADKAAAEGIKRIQEPEPAAEYSSLEKLLKRKPVPSTPPAIACAIDELRALLDCRPPWYELPQWAYVSYLALFLACVAIGLSVGLYLLR